MYAVDQEWSRWTNRIYMNDDNVDVFIYTLWLLYVYYIADVPGGSRVVKMD